LEKQTYDDQLIVKYLLGRLSDDEVERLDSLSFVDDEFSHRLQAVEDDLIDSYVNDELSDQDLERFHSHYLLTPRRREKVHFAKALHHTMNHSGKAARIEFVRKQSPLRSFRSLYTVLDPAVRWGMAAAAVLLLFSGFLLVGNNFRLRTRLQETQAELKTIYPQLEQQRSDNSEIENQLKNVRDQLSQLERQRAELQKPSQPRDLTIAHFELSPQLRSLDQITTISIPPGTDFVSFHLELEPGEDHIYRAELKPQSSNQVIWRSGKLSSSLGGKGRAADIRIPANLLVPRWYILELSTVSGSAAGVEAGYTFKVEKR
jgi:hypothetical protein